MKRETQFGNINQVLTGASDTSRETVIGESLGDDADCGLEASLRDMLNIDKHKVFEHNVCAAVPERLLVACPDLALFNVQLTIRTWASRSRNQSLPKTFGLPEPQCLPICRASAPWSLSAGCVLGDDSEVFRETVKIFRTPPYVNMGYCSQSKLTQRTIASFSATGTMAGHAESSASARL